MRITDVIKGAAVACLAAYLFLVLLGVCNTQVWAGSYRGSYSDLLFGGPLFVLALNSWFILPAGGVMGLIIPYLARKQTHKVAVCVGIGMGALIGVMGGLLGSYETASVEAFSFSRGIDEAAFRASFWRSAKSLCPAMSLYLMACAGRYAHLRAKQISLRRYL